MRKIYAQFFLIILFSAGLASCSGQNTPAAQVTSPPPSPQPSATPIPTPVPTDVFFPQSSEPGMDQMMAGLLGKLILVDGCPRLEGSTGESTLLFWPYNYTIERSVDPAQIRDDTGKVVARIGDYVEMGGGEDPSFTDKKWSNGCAGPLTIVGEGPRVLDPYFPQYAGGAGFSSTPDWLEGTLAVVNSCLRVQTDDHKSFLLIWSPGPHWDKNASQIQDVNNNVQAQVGEKIRVKGGGAQFVQSPPGDFTKPMVIPPLPKECAIGPYWLVDYIEK